MAGIVRWTVPDVWVPDALAPFFPEVGADMAAHRRTLKMDYLVYRDRCCRGCREPFLGRVAHMHEGILSKRDVQGWPREWRVLINVPYCCILLCRDCNLGLADKHPPPRARVLTEHVHMYGPGVVRWLRSLPFKSHPLRGLLEQYPR